MFFQLISSISPWWVNPFCFHPNLIISIAHCLRYQGIDVEILEHTGLRHLARLLYIRGDIFPISQHRRSYM